jgi:hypothetical protein
LSKGPTALNVSALKNCKTPKSSQSFDGSEQGENLRVSQTGGGGSEAGLSNNNQAHSLVA